MMVFNVSGKICLGGSQAFDMSSRLLPAVTPPLLVHRSAPRRLLKSAASTGVQTAERDWDSDFVLVSQDPADLQKEIERLKKENESIRASLRKNIETRAAELSRDAASLYPRAVSVDDVPLTNGMLPHVLISLS